MKRALLLLVLLGCARREEQQKPRAPSGEVWLSRQQLDAQQMRIEALSEQELGSWLDAPGRIAFDDLRVSHVFSPASGRLTRILAAQGQHVKKGAPLAEIDSPEAGGALADEQKARADLDAATRELLRQKDLFEAHAGSQRDLEQAQAARDRAQAELSRAHSRAALFGGRHFLLRAPVEGEVISRNANPGMELAGQYGGNGTPELFTVGSLDPVWALAEVAESELSRVRVGAPVQVKVVAFPDRVFNTRVETLSSALDPATRTARVRCTLKNPGRELLPEMYATVSIATPAHKALALPRSALLHVGDERVVFVQTGVTEDGLLKFQRRRVQVDESGSDLVTVKSGLAAGETVVVSGALLLSGML